MIPGNECVERKRVIVIEQNADLQINIFQILKTGCDCTILGFYPDLEEALPQLAKTPVDLLILGVGPTCANPSRSLSLLNYAQPESKVLVLVDSSQAFPVFEAIRAGVSGYLLKEDVPTRLRVSLDEVLNGGFPISSLISHTLLQEISPSPGKFEVLRGLTGRERECFQHIVEGKLYKEIAVRMNIRLETVRSHIRNIYQKLGVKTRTEAAVKYLSMPTHALETTPARKIEAEPPLRQQEPLRKLRSAAPAP
ncbi:MAG: response regulator transcription factor [Verrucomicrobiaceae bacterium]|nr:MAG: response regulator transcription factor [Verrucomicrobiaceae bacterium]